mmetsp:Transcript_16607/g.23406  ORF Transcript_16607/g.23406 Transcript_16607/m.23406 type:complete len:209 (+) Transcript_16607:84-710(+)
MTTSSSSSSITTSVEIENSKIYNLVSNHNDNTPATTTAVPSHNESSSLLRKLIFYIGISCMVIVSYLSNSPTIPPQPLPSSSSLRSLSAVDSTAAAATPIQNQIHQEEVKTNTINVKVIVHGGLQGNEESLTYALSHAIHRDTPSIENYTMKLTIINKRSDDGVLSKPISIFIPNGLNGNEDSFLQELIYKEQHDLSPFPFEFDGAMN